jgi:hypothetical protein
MKMVKRPAGRPKEAVTVGREMIAMVKGSEAYRGWYDRLYAHMQEEARVVDRAHMFDMAMRDLAKKYGFKEEQPRR